MSVKECNRHMCENVMCDRYSERHGYICNECFRELEANQNVNIDAFMTTKPKRYVKTIYEEFKLE